MIGCTNINQGKRLHNLSLLFGMTFKKQCKTTYEKHIFNYYLSILIHKL